LKIVADENIPLLKELLDHCRDVHFLPGRQIKQHSLKDADVLLVRSITRVNEELLAGTSVKFVGTATAGTDHLDTTWLEQQGIHWVDTPGCNAEAVAEYVLACIAYLRTQGLLQHKPLRAGVIGIGHVGKKVVKKLKILEFEVLQNDPPRADAELEFDSTPLAEFTDLDFISVHTSLTKTGKHSTYQLINQDFLQRQKPGAILLNAGRGEVIHFSDLATYGKHLVWCFDVWENEPSIDTNIAQQALIATPHIAGYTQEAKFRSSYQLADALKKHLDLPISFFGKETKKNLLISDADTWEKILLELYNPSDDTAQLKNIIAAADIGSEFDYLRKHYHWRHEWANLVLSAKNLSIADKKLLQQLQISIQD
jgi:erythronate-4-phosphate dehydrogenase